MKHSSRYALYHFPAYPVVACIIVSSSSYSSEDNQEDSELKHNAGASITHGSTEALLKVILKFISQHFHTDELRSMILARSMLTRASSVSVWALLSPF